MDANCGRYFILANYRLLNLPSANESASRTGCFLSLVDGGSAHVTSLIWWGYMLVQRGTISPSDGVVVVIFRSFEQNLLSHS
jgi:hypothetical protein